ncbi:DinB family protein [Truepera radiovictrix]|uniref:DinB-like domain-containing protein n=1 Tax=Truepera radiovictrix (strain DSM 17093 / CIP 108686 / LMG 22925 / RQ-24) TaxID=649638 RepID=D7CVI2_TRURR|nr:DinB family protein [Truepera radiovictrix]ADI14210.1 conserved hypothetical protein [Truepera radiovictrix DSM 17093]WMT57232.1 DinB family protein [Truepera radiovictrix]
MFSQTLLTRFGETPEAAKAALERELTRFEALLPKLEGRWTEPLRAGAWSPAEVTEHVLKISVSMSKTLYLLRQGRATPPEAPRTPGVLVEGRAQSPEFGLPGEPQPWSALAPRWAAMRSRLLEEVDATTEWHGRSWFHPYFGDLSALGWVQAAALHLAHHRKQLEAVAR